MLTLIQCPFHPRVNAVACKRPPGHSAKSAGGRLHLNMHSPLSQPSRSGLTIPLSGHSVGIYQEMSSHATHQGKLSHNRLSSCVRKLISTFREKEKKKRSWGMNCQTFSEILAREEKATTSPHHYYHVDYHVVLTVVYHVVLTAVCQDPHEDASKILTNAYHTLLSSLSSLSSWLSCCVECGVTRLP